MGEHATGIEKWVEENLPVDIYMVNFIVLMVLTVIEVAAVFFGESMSLGMVWPS